MDSLSDFWTFIVDEDNRATIAWLFGSMAAVASALWAGLQFLFRKKDEKKDEGTPRQQYISADRGGIAGGRDVNVGLRGLSLLLLIVVIISVAILLASRIGDRLVGQLVGEGAPLEKVSLSLFCGLADDDRAHWVFTDEANQLAAFVDELSDHEGQPIYASVRIERECNACECQRELLNFENSTSIPWDEIDREPEFIISDQNGSLEPVLNPDFERRPDDVQGEVFFNLRPVAERQEWGLDVPSIWREGYEIFALLPDYWAYTHVIYLPRRHHLTAAQYRSGEYGAVISFDGVFIARSYDQTGGGARHLEPMELNETLQAQLSCIREDREPTALNRLLWGC